MKRLLVSIPILMLAMLSYSQNVKFSFIASPELTWFSGNDDAYETDGTYLGLNTGLEIDFFFTENYAFTTGLTINTIKGGVLYSDSIRYTAGDSEKILVPGSLLTHTLQYINIPLGLKFNTIEIGYNTYWLSTGVSPMIRIKSKVSDEQEVFSKTDFKDETRLFNMSYFIKGGLKYSLGGNTALIGGLGYSSGFVDITESSREKLQTRAFSVILGIQF
ncbi:MAG: porin family protein [Bacteroidales bacterium]